MERAYPISFISLTELVMKSRNSHVYLLVIGEGFQVRLRRGQVSALAAVLGSDVLSDGSTLCSRK